MKKALLLASLIAVAGLAQAQSSTYAIDPTHTYATFEIKHFGTSTNRARFDKKEGTVQFDKAGKTGKVEITLDVDSIDSGFSKFDSHLKSPDVFDVAKFPTAKFVSTKFNFSGDKVATVDGELTLKGKTAPITLKAVNFNCYDNPMLKREVCGGDFETVFDRTQFGVDYGVQYGFPKEVKVVIQVEAIKQ
ncbi:polyisoprenoid-binding protein [Roseateles aquatilis]|uniref:Polyisoprenoid-binding protein n=1 Tax=Roseateles aquatilis TaxID=431061 RepID=A0A2D0ALV7_9BURK|nr:YceI family protein [Roseateles aquatilis]OWQ83149.1 polyisoprenoid-binding protein [Roseateles aquatilis]